MKKISIFLLSLVFFSLACSTSMLQAKLVDSTSKKMPSWIGKTTEDKKNFYFSGSSTQQNSFETARKLAIRDALTQLIESLDLTMSVNTTRILTQTQTYLEDKSTSKTSDIKVIDTKIENIYFEKYDNSGNISYNVFVLLKYTKKEYEKEKARLEQEYSNYKQNVANRVTKANTLIASNSYDQALDELFEALKIVYEYGVCKSSQNEIVAKINDLLESVSFKSIYNFSQNYSGASADIDVYFNDTNNKYSKASFQIKTSNDFSLDTINTDDNGKLNYQFTKISFLKKLNYKVELDIQKTYNLSDEFLKEYSFKDVYTELDFLKDKKKVCLNVNTNNEQLINLLKTSLVQNGFNVVKNDSNFTLNLNCVFGDTSKNELNTVSNSTLYISNASVTAELFSTSNKESINSISFDEKGFGKTKDKAYLDLLQKISVSTINML